VSETNEANCETLNGNPNATTGNTWGLYTCVCNSGWGGVDCTVQLIQVPHCLGIDAHSSVLQAVGLHGFGFIVQATRIKLVTFTGGFTLLETQEEHVNLQVALSSSVKDDVVKGEYSTLCRCNARFVTAVHTRPRAAFRSGQ
jgi:hypothetical protein